MSFFDEKPKISIVVISYNMGRELPRTLESLSVPYQLNMGSNDIEVIVVDNGSNTSPIKADLPGCAEILYVKEPTRSPAKAVNIGLARASADLIGVMIDGARLASPGLCHMALSASRLSDRVVISSLGFHLGPDIQRRSIKKGYCQSVEDELLKSIRWPEQGYRLFEVSVFAGSSKGGWFSPIAESNALFMKRRLWDELGGYDEEFVAPGGGLVNLDVYVRACELPNITLVTILGEGTFHQIHGGISTNQERADASWAQFHEEYMRLRGKRFKEPSVSPIYFGTIRKEMIPGLRHSLNIMERMHGYTDPPHRPWRLFRRWFSF